MVDTETSLDLLSFVHFELSTFVRVEYEIATSKS